MRDKVPAGKKVSKSLREIEKEIERDLLNGIACQGGNLTVLELTERYLAQKRNVRPTTQAGYKTVVNVLKKDTFGGKRIDTVKTSDAKFWLISLQTAGRSYSSIHSIRGVLRPAFRMAVEDDLVRKNPFDFPLADALTDDSVKREALTPRQERTFLKFVEEDDYFKRYYDGIFILFKTGLRISELCGLTLRDIDLKEGTISIDHQLQVTAGKGAYIEKTKTAAGVRVLPMTDEVQEAFRRVISNRKNPKIETMIDGYSGFLFLDDRGKPMKSYQWEKRFQHAVQKHNKIYKEELPRITPHVARHTYCTNMVRRQVSVKTLQYLMGHADITTTLNVYTHLKMEDAKNELERLKIEEEVKKKMGNDESRNARKELRRIKSC